METSCPHCLGSIPESARYCRHCTRLVTETRNCEHCTEPIAPNATICPHCRERVTKELDADARSFNRLIVANRLGAFLSGGGITALFHPPRLEVVDGLIKVTRWSFLTLRVHYREVRFDRVASVNYTKGIFWGGILVETFGGATDDINQKGFDQLEARDMANELKRIIAR